jgi:tRNA-2-methylthio-N6-dimethylallyladenosine synthase
MTNHPKDMGDDVILTMKECRKVVEQVHLPVQSGSDRMLRLMNRGYTRADYLDTVRRIRAGVEGVSLSTDIIVGFPGETEEDFMETLSLVEEVGYDMAFTFIYSRRKYTPADRMEEQIPDDVKHERFRRLVEVVNRHCEASSRSYQGRTCEVLVEGPSKNNKSVLQGKTRTGKTVNFKGEEDLVGKLVQIRIVKARPFSLYGEVVLD